MDFSEYLSYFIIIPSSTTLDFDFDFIYIHYSAFSMKFALIIQNFYLFSEVNSPYITTINIVVYYYFNIK